jgi:hypothetical protein
MAIIESAYSNEVSVTPTSALAIVETDIASVNLVIDVIDTGSSIDSTTTITGVRWWNKNLTLVVRKLLNQTIDAEVTLLDGVSTHNFTAAAISATNAGALARGVVVGSGNTPSSFLDTSLAALIPHGTASGQLSYGVQTITNNLAWPVSLLYDRTLSNTSGGEVTIREIGLVGGSTNSASSTASLHLLGRKVLPVPIVVPDGWSVRIRSTTDWSDTASLFNSNGAQVLNHIRGATTHTLYNLASGTTSGSTAGGVFLDIDTLGVRVGTGTTAVNRDSSVQRTLATQIAKGTSAGQLDWVLAMDFSGITSAASGGSFIISRDLVNTSGGEVTIREAAYYAKTGSIGSSTYFMMLRHVLDGAITVPNGATLPFTIGVKINHVP